MIWSAFIVGLLGSLHCIGMCGPIALALPIPIGTNRFIGTALYNIGRIITYGFIGLLFGAFGSIFILAGLQQFLSIFAGITLLLMAIIPLIGRSKFMNFNFWNKLMFYLKDKLSHYLKKYSFSSLFFIGLLNGLLPCGLVYVSIIGALATGNTFYGAGYMILFGIGTAPALFLVSVLKNSFKNEWRNKFSRVIPFAICSIGLLLILRGLNLGIPYLSPQLSSEKVTATCCTKH